MTQLALGLSSGWGGKRPGAGRKRSTHPVGIPHLRRPDHSRHHPVHVTVRARRGLPSLRSQSLFCNVRKQIGVASRRFLRIVHFSVQSNHIHLLVEAENKLRLGQGMKGLAVRIARAINRVLSSRGNVWIDRYHAHTLKTPREVRNALAYVLFNHRKHTGSSAQDPCSSVIYFDAWVDQETPARASARSARVEASLDAKSGCQPATLTAPPIARPQTWLLSTGWKRLGLLRRGG